MARRVRGLLHHRPHWLLLLSALLPLQARAAGESLTLDQAIQEARSRNPEYLRSQAAADEASAREFEALSGYLPRLTASAGYLFKYQFMIFPLPASFGGGSIPAPNPIAISTFDLGINVFDGFRTTNTYRAARLENDAARREASWAELQLDGRIRLLFYRALSAQLLADVADQNVKTLQDHLAKTKALLSGGASTKLDTLRVEVQLSEAMPDQIQAHDNVVLSRKELAEGMGLESDERPVSGTLPVPNQRELPADLKLEATRRDDLIATEERADAASKTHLATYSPWIPQVSLLAEYQYYYNNPNQPIAWTSFLDAYSFGIGLTWNIFDGANIARMHEAAARQVQAEKTAAAAVQRAPVEFETWKRRFLSNVALYHARTEAIESATESVRLARISYEAGTRTSSEVLDAELDLFRARAGVVRAQLDSAEALINLELAVGHNL